MKFKNSIKFKNGTLNRGDYCLYHNHPCIYMGSYQENDYGWIHMLRIRESFIYKGLPYMEENIIQCEDKSEIVCKVQMIPFEKGQMQL